ncbi:hypothetical protein ACFE04_014746 [Oxalis oulophora]
MQKLGFPSMKTLSQFKSLSGSGNGAPAKSFAFASRPSSLDSISSGSFASLKLTAEKLVKEQASVKTDLEMANTKLKKSVEHIRALEEKLQDAMNDNAQLKVKQKEDERLWKGLESKFSSTKTLCDQLTETLQHLAGQVQDAEKDKELFEDKLSASSDAFDSLNDQMNDLSLKLSSTEKVIRIREKEVEDLKNEKEENDMIFRDEQRRMVNLIGEKDAMIKQFEATVATSRQAIENLNSKLGEVQRELELKQENIRNLLNIQENLQKEKCGLQLSNADFEKKLQVSLNEIKNLENFVQALVAQVVELNKQSLSFLEKFDQLNSLYDSRFKLAQQERELVAEHSQKRYEQLHEKFLIVTSEKDELVVIIQELNSKITELQRAHDSATAQFSEESRLAGEKIKCLEAESGALVSKNSETEMLVSKLEEQIGTLSESLKSSEKKIQDLLSKHSSLESMSKDETEKLLAEIQGKSEKIDNLQKEIEKHVVNVDSLEKQVCQLNKGLEDKELLVTQYKERLEVLDNQISENHSLLSAAELKVVETKKQYEQMLESKQLELSKHLKEISQRNDQAINDIRRKYEVEKVEIINTEKEKADKIVGEMQKSCDDKLAECKEEARQNLLRIQEEHAALVSQLQQDYDMKELKLKAEHNDELKRAQLEAENELREKVTTFRNEHDVQMKALRCQYEEDCNKLQEELDLQKSKEDRQRALLQMQWKVMSTKPQQEDQEVNSRKVGEYSTSSIQKLNNSASKRSQRDLEKVATQTPVTKLLNKVETRSGMSIPKHHKVTHDAYEVGTNKGDTVTKRRKARSTVMFEDPIKHKKTRRTPRSTPKIAVQEVKGPKQRSNIGDLFSEGSLNPYADDPYAFD